MEMTSLIDMLLGLIVAGGAWWANGITKEQKRVEILLNKTREDYIKRSEHSGELDRVTEHLIRLETKLDRLSEKITYGKTQ